MKVVSQIADHLHAHRMLSPSQVQRLETMGLLGYDSTDDYGYECPCCYHSHALGQCMVCGQESPWCRCLGSQRCPECGAEPCRCQRSMSSSGATKEGLKAVDIAARIESQALLRAPALEAFSVLAGEDWLQKIPGWERAELERRLLKLIATQGLPADLLWEGLSYAGYRRVVGQECGPAVSAWRWVLSGPRVSDMAAKHAWILGREPAIKRVWLLLRCQSLVLESLGRLLGKETLAVGRWAQRRYHPLGSLALCLVYQAQAEALELESGPVDSQVWSHWDGQKHAKQWVGKESLERSWELALRMASPLVFRYLIGRWGSLESETEPTTLHPQQWRPLSASVLDAGR